MARYRNALHRTTWWRSQVVIERGIIKPVPPFTPYDPFDFHFPQREATREQRSLCYVFADLDPNDHNEVLAFCDKYGVLGRTRTVRTIKIEAGWPSPEKFKGIAKKIVDLARTQVRVAKEMYERDKVDKAARRSTFLYRHGQSPDPHLCTALSLNEFRLRQAYIRELVQTAQKCAELGPGLFGGALRNSLGIGIAGLLNGVRPRLTWDIHEEKWLTGWEICTLESAMALMLMCDVQGAGSILTCPKCHTTFLGDHPRTLYCSPSCQNAAKVQRFRSRNKSNS